MDEDIARAFFDLVGNIDAEETPLEDPSERIVPLRLGRDGVARCPDCGCSQFVDGPRRLIGSRAVSFLLSPKHVVCAGCGVLLAYGHGRKA